MGDSSLEGWAPMPGEGITLDEIVERAFDYRGDVTVVLRDGREVVGYLYNRDRNAAEPYVEVLEPSGPSVTLRYRDIRTIRFTGRDTAAGGSYEAWLRRKAEAVGRREP